MIPCTDTSYQYITVGQMSIKLIKIPQPKLTIDASSALGVSSHTEDNSTDVNIDISTDITTYANIADALN